MNTRTAVLASMLLVWMALGWAQPAADMAGDGVERARIARERAAVEARFGAEKSQCYQRFAVNDCLAQANARKREALADLRRQEVSLDDTERKRKGAAQIQRMEDKSSVDQQQEQADRRAKALQDQQERVEQAARKQQARSERQGDAVARQAEAASRQQSLTDKAGTRATKRSEAELHRLSHEDKLRQSAQHREDLAKRLAEQDKPPAQPLPLRP